MNKHYHLKNPYREKSIHIERKLVSVLANHLLYKSSVVNQVFTKLNQRVTKVKTFGAASKYFSKQDLDFNNRIAPLFWLL